MAHPAVFQIKPTKKVVNGAEQILLAGVVCLSALFDTAHAIPVNLLTNGSFESGDGDTPIGSIPESTRIDLLTMGLFGLGAACRKKM